MLLVLVVVAAVVVALVVRDSGTTPGGTGTGAAESNPYDEAYGTFEPISRAGVAGKSLLPLPVGESAAGIITAQYAGPGYFDVGFQLESMFLSVIRNPYGRGPYSGSVAYWPSTFRLDGKNGVMPPSLSVFAGGPWEVTIAPISTAPELPATATGLDAVFLYNGDGANLVVEHQQRRRLALSVSQWGLDPGPDQDFRARGFRYLKTDRYSETVRLAPGPSVVTIDSFDRWTSHVE